MAHRFHCCASCTHFRAMRTDEGVKTVCARLGYETRPTYQFHCWTPNDRVQKRMQEMGARASKERES
ncbi:hypothetical protein N007_11385 [Alicyclobacillus acidoterrestris ATCC 49025]|nr:hypothetical protein N007_11385 [Alicyclobacillus acidoterrestris ATCC 49025]